MFKTFQQSFRLAAAYRKNTIIYLLKQLPLLKRLFKNTLYSSKGVNAFAKIVSAVISFSGIFLGKFLYVGLIFLIFSADSSFNSSGFMQVLVVLAINGAAINSNIFSGTVDRYYAIILMRLDAREYILSNYTYSLLKILIGFLPPLLIFGSLLWTPIWQLLLYPLYVVGLKAVFCAVSIYKFEHQKSYTKDISLKKALRISAIYLLIAAVAIVPTLSQLNWILPDFAYLIVFGVTAAAGAFALKYIFGYKNYLPLSKYALRAVTGQAGENITKTAMTENYNKKIEVKADVKKTSGLSGIKFFNALFISRHKKLLTKSAVKFTVILFALAAFAVVSLIYNPDLKEAVNIGVFNYFSASALVLYFINRGQIITQAMFVNCDSSMLTYKFYREPSFMLKLFWERLKSLTAINMLPTGVLMVFLPVIVAITGGTAVYNYFIIVISLFVLTVFFSLHSLVLYYLLQPYNENMETKSFLYIFMSSITYGVCYILAVVKTNLLYFGLAAIGFCAVYIAVSALLIYKFAPKRFKIRR